MASIRLALGDAMRYFVSKDLQKMLKQKDSDAADHGNGIEDLCTSFVNEIRTADGAKRQQQRFCGPKVALSFNFFVAVSIIMINKLVLGKIGFNYPIALTSIHYTVSWILLALCNAFSILPAAPSKATPFSSLLTLGVVMSFASGLANVSLQYNSVGFYQMAKIAVTPSIVAVELLLFRKRVLLQKGVALTVVSVGVAVATVTDLQFNLFGALAAVAWIVPSSANKILWTNLQQQENWTALALMWKTTPITLLALLAIMPWLDPPGLSTFNWTIPNISAISVSALLGFLLQWSGALALGATSAITHVVLGQFKTCVIILGGYLLFESNPGAKSLCGASMALSGMAMYMYLNLREGNDSVKLAPGFSSFKAQNKVGKIQDSKEELNSV